MRQQISRKRPKPPTCDLCSETLETAATPRNPSAELRPHTLARCPNCLILCVLDETLQPCGDEVLDEDTFDAATNSSAEMRTWVDQTLTTHRLQGAAEVTADCTAARAWVAAREGGHIADTATLGRFARSFDPKSSYNIASRPIQDRARWLLDQWRRHSGEWIPPVWGR